MANILYRSGGGPARVGGDLIPLPYAKERLI
jgi:hypothetical protein